MPYNPYFNQYSAYPPTQPSQFQYTPSTQPQQQPVHGFVYGAGMPPIWNTCGGYGNV